MTASPGGLPWRTLCDLRESFEASDLPMTVDVVDVVDWYACTAQFRHLVGAQLERID